MSKPVVITARISEELSGDLDRLAALRDRSRAWLIEKAVSAFVREDLDLRLSLEKAEAEIDRGEFYTQDQMEEWLAGYRRAEAAE